MKINPFVPWRLGEAGRNCMRRPSNQQGRKWTVRPFGVEANALPEPAILW